MELLSKLIWSIVISGVSSGDRAILIYLEIGKWEFFNLWSSRRIGIVISGLWENLVTVNGWVGDNSYLNTYL